MTQKQYLDKPVTSKEIDSIMSKQKQRKKKKEREKAKKSPGSNGFTGKLYQTLK